MLLCDARIADSHRHTLERELEDLVNRVEGGRQRDFEIRGRIRECVIRPDPIGRKQRDRDRIVVLNKIQVTIVLPVDPNPRAMRSTLPGDGIGQVESTVNGTDTLLASAA